MSAYILDSHYGTTSPSDKKH